MMASVLHPLGLIGRFKENNIAVDRTYGTKFQPMGDVLFGSLPGELGVSGRHGPARMISKKKLRKLKSFHFTSRGPDYMDRDGLCGCGGRREYMGKRLSATEFGASHGRSSDRKWTARMDMKSHSSASGETSEKHRQPSFLKSKSGNLVRRSQRGLASLPYVDGRQHTRERQSNRLWNSCQRNLVTAAAVAGLSFSLCSSALATPLTNAWGSTPGYLQEHVETQLMQQLQAEIKAQKKWLDDIGQPMRQWSIDDRVKEKLFVGGEGKADTRLDESGKSVTTHKMESAVVPLFKPSEKERIKAAKNVGEENSQDKQLSSKSSAAILSSAPGLVAVASLPLGSVVSAARGVASIERTVVATALSTAPVPGLGLMTRIMMHLGGGGIAGALGATLVYPLDTIKTRMQAQRTKDGEKPQYKDEVDCLRQLVAEGGVGILYSGLVPQLIGIAPEKAMKLTVNEVLMEMLESQMPGVGVVLLELIAGGGGGFSQVLFTNPMEAVKVRLQTQSKDSEASMWEIVKELGMQGLYNGSLVTMARDIPSTAIFFAVYTFIMQIYPDQNFLAGCIAAVPATVLVTPMDVIKTRLQMERTEEEEQYENAWQCFSMILQKEGPGALFKGSLARVLKTSPQFGITLMLYDILCHFH